MRNPEECWGKRGETKAAFGKRFAKHLQATRTIRAEYGRKAALSGMLQKLEQEIGIRVSGADQGSVYAAYWTVKSHEAEGLAVALLGVKGVRKVEVSERHL